MSKAALSMLLAAAGCLASPSAQAQRVDARDAVPAPAEGYLKPGAARSPDGTVLGINNRYLTLDNEPWMPVMGEIHFVRLPRSEWAGALARIKASGVDVVATYLFWNYHEETPGAFNCSGERDVRAFVEEAQRHGLKVVVRLGPWAHGEVRYGGLPDWIVRELPTRGSDPRYMSFVDRYWAQIGEQLTGLLWKDGGPIIGVQLENEYNLTGETQGRKHIADLKALALRHGFDVPFYTVTGWDGAVYPRGEVVPVFGGYPDEPWGRTADRLPPKETYAFRFDSRVSGNLGAQTRGSRGDADPDIPNTPFLGAEYGGGVPTMYRRRPVIVPDDIAAMLPVQLGSGVNLYGYYMYHGGRNLIGRTTLEEKTSIGGYNDVPIIDYDFQAPFGGYGEAGEVASYIRPFHYMMHSYGAALAPTTVRKPATTPDATDDLATLRWSARSNGDNAFVFVNNYVRQYRMEEQAGTRFTLALPGGMVTFPSKPVTVPSGAYFIWPVGLDLGGQTLSWASAQPVTRIDTSEGALHVFATQPGITAEFAFPTGTRISGVPSHDVDGQVVAQVTEPSTGALLKVAHDGQPTIRVLVLTQDQSRQLWRVNLQGATHLVLTRDQVVEQGNALAFTSLGDPDFEFSVWPKLPDGTRGSLPLTDVGSNGIFTRHSAHATPRNPHPTVVQVRAPGAAPAIPVGGPADRAMQPWPETFGRVAGAWEITVPDGALDGLDDAFLRIDWAGDIGRLFAGTTLIDDRFFDGREWRVGLRRHADHLGAPLTLRASPLRADAPVYIDETLRPEMGSDDQIAEVRAVTIEPRYRLTVSFR